MAVKYNKTIFLKQVNKLVSSPRIKRLMQNKAQQEFQKRKNKLMQDFQGHRVTQEILAGPESPNFSGTLTGRGNLFTFIGFSEMANPINTLYYALQKGIIMS